VKRLLVHLVDLLDALHEARELLELRPLVVDHAERLLDLDALLDACHGSSLVSALPWLFVRVPRAG
jgi:hypothetical protein